jgi:hypothetical protein
MKLTASGAVGTAMISDVARQRESSRHLARLLAVCDCAEIGCCRIIPDMTVIEARYWKFAGLATVIAIAVGVVLPTHTAWNGHFIGGVSAICGAVGILYHLLDRWILPKGELLYRISRALLPYCVISIIFGLVLLGVSALR